MTVFSPTLIAVFSLVLARVSGLVVVAPVFGARQAPVHTKVGLAVAISLIITPLQVDRAQALPSSLIVFGLLVGREALVGLAVGFAVSLVFTGVQIGSQLLGVQIGFGLGGLLNPASGADSGVLDSFFSVLATVIFLAANGHHAVLAALVRTFELTPIAGAGLPAINPIQVMALIQAVFVIAIRIALPVIGALLLTDVAMGFVGRAAPNMQVMVVGAPVKITVGLLFLIASMPTTAALLDSVYRGAGLRVTALLGG